MESYSLKWNNHNSTMITALSGLLGTGSMTDVTLAADGQLMAAHSVILSACSSYFEMQLKTAGMSGKHPVIVLHDVRFRELKAIVEFMYCGEVSVAEDDLPRLLAIGDNLQIKGLAERAGDETCVGLGLTQQLQQNGMVQGSSPRPPSRSEQRVGGKDREHERLGMKRELSRRHVKEDDREEEVEDDDEDEMDEEEEQMEPKPLIKKSRLYGLSNNNLEMGRNLTVERSRVKKDAPEDFGPDGVRDNFPELRHSLSSRSEVGNRDDQGNDSCDEDSYDEHQGIGNALPQNFSAAADPCSSPCWPRPEAGCSGLASSSSSSSLPCRGDRGRFCCRNCGKSYAGKGSLLRHVNYECGVEPRFPCPLCARKFQRRHNLNNHFLSCSRNNASSSDVFPS